MKRYKVRMSNGNTMLVDAVSLVDAARKAEAMCESVGIYAQAMEIEDQEEKEMSELNSYLEELSLCEREHKARMYSRECKRNVKRKINIDWQSENCTLCALAGALLLALVTMILQEENRDEL